MDEIIELLEDYSALWEDQFDFEFSWQASRAITSTIKIKRKFTIEEWIQIEYQYNLIVDKIIKRIERSGWKIITNYITYLKDGIDIRKIDPHMIKSWTEDKLMEIDLTRTQLREELLNGCKFSKQIIIANGRS